MTGGYTIGFSVKLLDHALQRNNLLNRIFHDYPIWKTIFIDDDHFYRVFSASLIVNEHDRKATTTADRTASSTTSSRVSIFSSLSVRVLALYRVIHSFKQ